MRLSLINAPYRSLSYPTPHLKKLRISVFFAFIWCFTLFSLPLQQINKTQSINVKE